MEHFVVLNIRHADDIVGSAAGVARFKAIGTLTLQVGPFLVQEAHVKRIAADALAAEGVHVYRCMSFHLSAAGERLVSCARAGLANPITVALKVVARRVLTDAKAVAAQANSVPRPRDDRFRVRVWTEVLLRSDDVREGWSLPISAYLVEDSE